MKIYKNNKGFSLVQVMVGLGLTGIVSLGVFNQLDKFKSSSVKNDRKIELNNFLDNVTKTLVAKQACDFNFSGKNIEAFDPTILYANNTSKVLIQEGESYLAGAVTIDSISLNRITGQDSAFNLTITAKKNKEQDTYNIVKRNIVISADMTGAVVNSCYFKMSDIKDLDTICKGPGVDTNNSSGEMTCYFKNFELNTSTLDHSCDDGYLLKAINYPNTSANPYQYLETCSKTFTIDTATSPCASKRVKKINPDGSFECFDEAQRFNDTAVVFNTTAEYKLIVNTSNEIQLALGTAASTSCPSGTVSCTPSCQGSWTEITTIPGPGSCSGTYYIGSGVGTCSKNSYPSGYVAANPGLPWVEGSGSYCSGLTTSSTCTASGNQYRSHTGNGFSCSWSGTSGTPAPCSPMGETSCIAQSGCSWNPTGGGSSSSTTNSCTSAGAEASCTAQNSACTWDDCGGNACVPVTTGGGTCTPDASSCALDVNDPFPLCSGAWVQNGVNNCGDTCTYKDTIACGSGGTTGGGGTSGGGGGCFVAGTEISMFDGSKKYIEDVTIDDILMGTDNKEVRIKKLIKFEHDGYKYSFNGSGYFVTGGHPFKTLKGWKAFDLEAAKKDNPNLAVQKLEVGDIIYTEKGLELVREVDRIKASETVYNFHVDRINEYIANGYQVHNKLEAPDGNNEPSP